MVALVKKARSVEGKSYGLWYIRKRKKDGRMG